MDSLRAWFSDDGDGTGELKVRAEAGGFAALGAAYFGLEELLRFCEAIGSFPLPEGDARLNIQGGFWSQEQHGQIKQEHLGINVYFADAARGYIGIQVRAATPVWPHTRPNSKMMATVEVVTTYEPLARFARALKMVLQGKAKEAVLEGQAIA